MYIKITSQMSTGNGLDPQKCYHYQGDYISYFARKKNTGEWVP